MKKTARLLTSILVALMLISTLTACGGKSTENEIVFGTSATFPPFEFKTENGIIDNYDGIDIALAKQIADENGMKAAIVDMDFEILLDALEDGQVNAAIAGITVEESRLEQVDFSIPYYTATQVMIIKEDSDIYTAVDIKDKKICVVQGYTGESCINEMGYPYEAYPTGADAVAELVSGNCDVVIIDSATAKTYVQDNAGLKIVEDNNAFKTEEYAIAVQKGDTELLNMINEVIESKLADGTIADWGIKYAEMDTE